MTDAFWVTIFSSGVIAALVSSLFTIVGNYAYFKWKYKRETTAGYINARIERYSKLWFFLRLWLLEPIDPPPTTSQFDKIDEFISLRLDLISQEIQNDWLKLRERVVEREFEDAVLLAQSLVNKIKTEFNDKLIPKYEEYMGEEIQKLSDYNYTKIV